MNYIEECFQHMGFNIQQFEGAEYEPLTDKYKITNRKTDWSTVLKWKESANDQSFWNSIMGRLRSILENEIDFDKIRVYNNNTLQQFIDLHNPILTPEEKIDKLLEYIGAQTKYDGDITQVHYADPKVLTALNFANQNECRFYFTTAMTKGLLTVNSVTPWVERISLTSDGLSRIIKIGQSKNSRYCFVAMSFDQELDHIYLNAIEKAVTATGFLPIRVDRIHVDSDKTINDEIIAGIKKSRFTIADFTGHKKGVYFEAGYALGRGQKVIYTCRENDITNAHFDIRNYQHIVWKDSEDLKRRLIDKIEAFIKD